METLSPQEGRLVRDNVIDLKKADGLSPVFRLLSPEELHTEVPRKLLEELHEAISAPPVKVLNECADVLEIWKKFLAMNNITEEMVEAARIEKKAVKGGFEKGIFWEGIE